MSFGRAERRLWPVLVVLAGDSVSLVFCTLIGGLTALIFTEETDPSLGLVTVPDWLPWVVLAAGGAAVLANVGLIAQVARGRPVRVWVVLVVLVHVVLATVCGVLLQVVGTIALAIGAVAILASARYAGLFRSGHESDARAVSTPRIGWAVVRGLVVLGLFAAGFAGWLGLMLIAFLGMYTPDGLGPGGWAALGVTVLMLGGALGAFCASPAISLGQWFDGPAGLITRLGASVAGAAGLLLAFALTGAALRAKGSLPLGSPGTLDLSLLGAAAAILVALGIGATLLPWSKRTRVVLAAGTVVGAVVLGGGLVALQRSSCQRLEADVLDGVARDWRQSSSYGRSSGDVSATIAGTLDECKTLERLGTTRTRRLLGRPDRRGERDGELIWSTGSGLDSDAELSVRTEGPRVVGADADY